MDRKTILHLSPLADIGGCEVNSLRVVEGLGGQDHRVLVFDREGPMSSQWRKAGARVDHLGRWSEGCRSFLGALRSWAESQPRPDGNFFWSTSRMPRVLGALRDWNVRWCVYLGNPVAPGLVSKARRWIDERLTVPQRSVTLAALLRTGRGGHRRARYFRRFETEVIPMRSAATSTGRGAIVRCLREPVPESGWWRASTTSRTTRRSCERRSRSPRPTPTSSSGSPAMGACATGSRTRPGGSASATGCAFSDLPTCFRSWRPGIYVHSTTAAEEWAPPSPRP